MREDHVSSRKEGPQIIKERFQLSIGQRVLFRAREQARGVVLVQATVQQAGGPGFTQRTKHVSLRWRKDRSRAAETSAILHTPGDGDRQFLPEREQVKEGSWQWRA